MDHEKRKKKKVLRKYILTGALIPIAALIGLVIIFFALGYRYDFKDKKLYLSSVLYLNSQPQGAKIYINDKSIGTTKLTNFQVKPGVYSIKLEKDGFKTWQAQTNVPPYSVVEIMPYLFYQTPEELNNIDFSNFIVSFSQKIFFTKNKTITYCDLPCDKIRSIDLDSYSIKNAHASQNKLFLDYGKYYLAIDSNDQSQQKYSYLNFKKIQIKKTIFNDRGIYVLDSNNDLYALNSEQPTKIASSVLDIDDFNNYFLYLTQNGQLINYDTNEKILIKDKIIANNYSADSLNIADLKLINYDNGTIYLKLNNDLFEFRNKQAFYIGKNIDKLITLDGYSAFLNSQGELYLKTPNDNNYQFVNRYFDEPKNIFFFSPEYIGLIYNKQLKIIETTTKQEFLISNFNQPIILITPNNETGLSVILNRKIVNYKITEGISFWQKILNVFRK